ncbi:MAG: hypothetical protein ACOYXT_18700, partial [Bacteroidota bacterium]
LDEIEGNNKKTPFIDKLQPWLNTSSLIIAVVVGVFSIIAAFNEYEQHKNEVVRQRRIQLNETMLQFVDSLRHQRTAEVQRAILLLQYYGKDSLPILLASLDTCQQEKHSAYLNAIHRTIASMMVYNEGEEKEIVGIINRRFGMLMKDQVNTIKISPDQSNTERIYNYLALYEYLPLEGQPKKMTLDQLNAAVDKLESLSDTLKLKGIIQSKINETAKVLKTEK